MQFRMQPGSDHERRMIISFDGGPASAVMIIVTNYDGHSSE